MDRHLNMFNLGLSTRALIGSSSSTVQGFGPSSFASVTPPPVGTRSDADNRTVGGQPPYPSPSPGASSQGSEFEIIIDFYRFSMEINKKSSFSSEDL